MFAAILSLAATAASAECLTLGNLGYILPVDAEMTVSESPNAVTLDLAPGGRAPRLIRLMSLEGQALQPDKTLRQEKLPNGMTVHFSTSTGEAGGSGGAEVLLTGWLEGVPSLGISCSTQQEYPNPRRCLPVLGEILPRADGCKTKED